jgi:hypothetical protein
MLNVLRVASSSCLDRRKAEVFVPFTFHTFSMYSSRIEKMLRIIYCKFGDYEAHVHFGGLPLACSLGFDSSLRIILTKDGKYAVLN